MKAVSRIILEEWPIERYGLIAVTDVIVSQKLENAKIYISAMSKGDDLVKDLNRRSRWISFAVSKTFKVQKMPELIFENDKSSERVSRIEQLLSSYKPQPLSGDPHPLAPSPPRRGGRASATG